VRRTLQLVGAARRDTTIGAGPALDAVREAAGCAPLSPGSSRRTKRRRLLDERGHWPSTALRVEEGFKTVIGCTSFANSTSGAASRCRESKSIPREIIRHEAAVRAGEPSHTPPRPSVRRDENVGSGAAGRDEQAEKAMIRWHSHRRGKKSPPHYGSLKDQDDTNA